MIALEWLRFFVGAALIIVGLLTFLTEIYGVFRFKYVLNRMHAAAMGDTGGLGAAIVGLIVMNGLDFTSVKLLLVVVFLWCASPVSSHLIAQLEATTNPESEEYCEMTLQELEKEEPAEDGSAEKEESGNA